MGYELNEGVGMLHGAWCMVRGACFDRPISAGEMRNGPLLYEHHILNTTVCM